MINPAKSYTIPEYIEILRTRIWYIVIPFILIASSAIAYAILAPRLYKASTLVVVSPQSIPEAFVQATVTSKVEERLQSIAQEVLSRTHLEKIISDLNLYQNERKTLSKEEVVSLMQENIKIELPSKKDEAKGHFSIAYIGRDPNVVSTVANRLSSQFIEENLKLREHQAESTTEFLDVELAAAKKKLDDMETKITQYKREHMGELPEQRDSNFKLMEQLENQYQRVGENLRAAQDRKLYIQKQLADMTMGIQGEKGGPASVLEADGKTTDSAPAGKSYPASSEIEILTRNLQDLRTRYTEDHPDVIQAKKRLEEFEKKKKEPGESDDARLKNDPNYKELNKLLTFTNLEIARLGEEERSLSGQIAIYRKRIEETPAREQDMASLMREYQSTKNSHETLLKKSQEARQAENLEKRQKGEQFRIIDPARTPEKPFSPDVPKILLIGMIAAVVAGLGLAFLREQMDRSFNDSGDVEITLGLKVLATIPRIENKAA